MVEYSIFKIFRENKNTEAAIKMAAYMKNNFTFLGINSPLRKNLQKDFLKELAQSKSIDWPFVFQCFETPEREFQYLAIDYLILTKKYLKQMDINKLEQLIQTKSWWDSVDGVDQLVGELALKYPEIIETHIRPWMKSKNIWLVRVSINFQLDFKTKTNSAILSEAILANLGSKEFFINKAIGWSLRQYAKFDKDWVVDFVEKNRSEMNTLSIREAYKHI